MDKRIIILLLSPWLVFWHWFEPAAKKNQNGVQAYHSQKYDAALKEFLSAKGIRPDSPELKNNTAAALYNMKKYKEALQEFSQINLDKSPIPKSDFYYNLGNSFFRLDQYEKALENYKKSLLANPGDINTKKNFELTLKKIEEQKKQDKKQDKKDDKDKQDQKKDEQQQQQEQQKEKEKQHQNILQYLNQNEKDQMKDKKRKVRIGIIKREKDW